MRKSLSAFLFALCISCRPAPVPTPNPVGAPTCKDVCARLADLKCEAAKPTPEGATCEDVCKNATSADSPIAWNLGCRRDAGTCAVIDRCEVN